MLLPVMANEATPGGPERWRWGRRRLRPGGLGGGCGLAVSAGFWGCCGGACSLGGLRLLAWGGQAD
jgi:hypothetical protein